MLRIPPFFPLAAGMAGVGVAPSLIPVISGLVTTISVDGPTATWTFTTDIASGTGAEWGPTAAYGTAAVNPPESVLSHSITVNNFDGLQSETDLHGRVAANGAGGIGYSADFTFSTKSYQQQLPGFGYFDKNRTHDITVGQTLVFMVPGYGYVQEIN